MKIEQDEQIDVRYSKPLIIADYTCVTVSHQELGGLIASLMHLAELDSDKEHRDALKGELKQRCRSWLDNLYTDSGYRNYQYQEGATVININPKSSTEEDALKKLSLKVEKTGYDIK